MSRNSDELRERLQKLKLLHTRNGCDRLYGRSAEESVLNNIYYEALTLNQNSPANLILICGDSGLGKTKLAETLRGHATEDDGFFIRGKFDQSSYGAASLPYSGIANAFEEYCSALERREDDRAKVVAALRKEIQNYEGCLLCEAIPSLISLIGDDNHKISQPTSLTGYREIKRPEPSEDATASKNRFYRLNYLLKKFIQVISSMGDPIIFLLDDMQWVDESSLDLIRALASSAKNPFVFVFTYRPVDTNHPFLMMIGDLESRNRVTEMRLLGLNDADVFDMISSILEGDLIMNGDCRQLSDFLCRITNGNPLALRQQIISLIENDLQFNDDGCMIWDVGKIVNSDLLLTDVISLTSNKIKKLPVQTQNALMICACIGTKISYELVGLLINDPVCVNCDALNADELKGKNALLLAVQYGLLIESRDGYGVSFAHDSVQSAAYSLLEPSNRNLFHLRLGRALRAKLNADSISVFLFTVASQFARGHELIQNDERLEVARIFVQAGDESRNRVAFREAHYFYSRAISMLSRDDWIQHYRLCSNVYINASDVAILTGAHEDAANWLEISSCQTKRSVKDQLRVTLSRVTLLWKRGHVESAIKFGMKSLSTLMGISIKPHLLTIQMMVGMVQTRRLMKGHNERTLLERPILTDEPIDIALHLLNYIALLCAVGMPRITPLVCFKIIELNIKYGISSTMPVAIAWYGVMLLHFHLPISEAASYCHLALRLQEVLNYKETRAQVAALCHGMIFILAKKLPDCIEPLFSGYLNGLEDGDIRHAMTCAQILGVCSFHSGKQLGKLLTSLQKFSLSMKEYNMLTLRDVNLVYEQAVSILIGLSGTSKIRTISPRGSFSRAREKTPFEIDHAATLQMMLAYTFDDYNLAWATSEQLTKVHRPGQYHIFYVATFFRGMAAVELSHVETHLRRKALMTRVKSCLARLKEGCKKSPINFTSYRYLLLAEYAVVKNNYGAAERNFRSAIEHASSSEVTHIHALSCERFARYYMLIGNKKMASENITMAHNLYSKWGARPKCELMERKYVCLLKIH